MILQKSGLFKATVWYSAGNLLVRLVNFILLPLYSNLISVEQFGIYSLLMSIYAIAAVFYQLGMTSSFTNFYLKELDENKRKIVFSSIINAILLLGVGLTVIIIALSQFLSQKILGSKDYYLLVDFIFIALFIDTVSAFILQLFKTLEQSKRVVMYMLVSAVLSFVLNILLVYQLKKGIYGIIIAQLVTSAAMFILLLIPIRKIYSPSIDNKIMKAVILFSLPLFISGLFASGVDVGDRFILDFFLGKKQVGEYSFAYRIAMITNIFVISFRTAWTPHALNRYHQGNYKDSFGKIFLKLLSAGILLLLVVSFFAEDLFKIQINNNYLFNPQYKGGLIILPYVILGYIFSSIAAFYSIYPFVSGKSYHFLVSDGLGLIANVVCNVILIPKLGMLGAGISTCVSFMIISFYLFVISKNKIEVDYQKKENLIIVLSGISGVVLGLLVNDFVVQLVLVALFLITAKFAVKIEIIRLFNLTK